MGKNKYDMLMVTISVSKIKQIVLFLKFGIIFNIQLWQPKNE